MQRFGTIFEALTDIVEFDADSALVRSAASPSTRGRVRIRLLVQERGDEIVRIEGLEILQLLTHANEVHRNVEPLGDCKQDARPGAAVEFGNDQPGKTYRGIEFCHL